MSTDPIISREPLLNFIVDRQLMSGPEVVGELNRQGIAGMVSDPEGRHHLAGFLSRALIRLPEGVFLSSLLTNVDFVSEENFLGSGTTVPSDPSEAYLPAPGTNDAIRLSPDTLSDEYASLPPVARRTAAWIATSPVPRIVVLTFDPGSLQDLAGALDFWIQVAAERRPDYANDLARPERHVLGFSTPHQILQPGERWRRMEVARHLKDAAESAQLDPFFETELALYCWYEGEKPPAPRALQDLADRILRRVIVRPRLYRSHLPSSIVPPAPPAQQLFNAAQNRWRALFTQLIEDCAREGDSDVHLLSKPSGGYSIERRRSGHLKYVGSIPAHSGPDYIAAALAGSGVELSAKKEIPKDGRSTIYLHGLQRSIDLRIAVVPGAPPFDTPAAVFRLLDPSTIKGGMEQLLFNEADRAAWNFAHSIKDGLALVTGPTGSGKSRTLYAFLQSLHHAHPDRSFKSIEDPIELIVGEWLQQNQVEHAAGSSFPLMIRAMLRSDPDVLFVGEIRDDETAREAVHGGRTGHLVVSSLHANDVASTPERLRGLGVPAGELKDLLRFVSSQELLGRSCPHCRTAIRIPESAREIMGAAFDPDLVVTANEGCPRCFNVGSRGRFASQSFLVVPEDDTEMTRAVGAGDSERIRTIMADRRIPTLPQRSLQFALGENAMTNIGEVLSAYRSAKKAQADATS